MDLDQDPEVPPFKINSKKVRRMVLDMRGLATVSHHGNGKPFPSWVDACRGRSVEPNPSFTHTVAGLWLERETAGRERGETEKDKSGEENKIARL